MARIESVSVGGYYPTPAHLVPRIACLFEEWPDDDSRLSILDPCAGEGAAVLELVNQFGKPHNTEVYACEMEAGRFEAFKKAAEWRIQKNILHGDTFRTTFTGGVNILYLNPPYDTDPVHGRLEEKFLSRFTPAIADGGALLFVVPVHALKASAVTLATHYDNLHCYKFPHPDFDTYKQVVLYARKGSARLEPDASIIQQVNGWTSDNVPELPDARIAPLPVSERYDAATLGTWTIRPIDVTSLVSKLRPWYQTIRGGGMMPVPSIIPELPVQELLLRSYPMATPSRPAHIAAGIASGLFNGARLESSNPKLPPLLVKGVFDREYRTVEEKRNKDGEVKSVVQIQQPKLVTTVLDLNAHTYHVLKTGTEETKSVDVASMTVADLLTHYGSSLMGVMEQQCPILYDPRTDAGTVDLPPSPRTLFTAQAHAARALVKLLGGQDVSRASRRGRAAILLGEIGSGKSTVSMQAARAIGAKRTLILCPPHLLTGWTNEITAVHPEAAVKVLQSVTDLDDVAAMDPATPVVCILSRETAKLSHGWEGVGTTCPKCGSLTPDEDLAKKRARCEVKRLRPRDALAKESLRLALSLSRYSNDAPISHLLRGRFDAARMGHYDAHKKVFRGLARGAFAQAIESLLSCRNSEKREAVERAIILALHAYGSDDAILNTARVVHEQDKGSGSYRSFAQNILVLLPPGDERQTAFAESARQSETGYYNVWNSFAAVVERSKTEYGVRECGLTITWKDGVCEVDDAPSGGLRAHLLALSAMVAGAKWSWSPACGEFLFQASPSPRRVALARHIVKHQPDLFDCLVLDEGHEYSTDGSAQERSAHRLTSLGIPTILMTGSIMNGYATSLFTNMWALSPDFRSEFSREDGQRFVDRYGYRKRILEDRDRQTGEIVEFGAMSDRVTRSERMVGNAPGVLPLFLLRHLLPMAVTLHKTDLAIDLPPCRQFVHKIDPGPVLLGRYTSLQARLVAQIRSDQFKPELSGRLWGQLAEIPSYLDRATADTGNDEDGYYRICYPESCGGGMVASREPFDAETILPKEEWLLDTVAREVAEGRNVMVFTWHVCLLPRLARLISERIGEKVPILHSDKVATAKRQAWIDKEVVKAKRRVMVTNPVAVQTGLNNLVHFATEVWMENPACNPVVFRQAIGRVDRIGQKRETRIHFPVYDGTLQVQLYDLLMKKVAVSVSTDGLDPESALQAAGVGEDEYLAGLSIGKQLWSMLTSEAA